MTAHRLAPDEDGYVYRRRLPDSDPDPIRCDKCGRECEDDGWYVPGMHKTACRPCALDHYYDAVRSFVEEWLPTTEQDRAVEILARWMAKRTYRRASGGKWIARFQ